MGAVDLGLVILALTTVVTGQLGRTEIQRVVTEVESACIFPNNHLYLRRVAFVDTADGEDPNLALTGEDFGGPWRVTEEMLNATQERFALITNDQYIREIRLRWGIEWELVTFPDLSDPLVSALGCLLYTFLNDEFDGIPSMLEDQGEYWARNYRIGGDPERYLIYSEALSQYCVETLDLILLVGDDYVGDNQILVKYYMTTIINAFTIGADETRVGILKYGTTPDNPSGTEVILSLADIDGDEEELDNGAVIEIINLIEFTGGSPTLHRGLEDVREVMFQEDAGARPFDIIRTRRTVVVFSNGQSDDPDAAVLQAQLNQDAFINSVVVVVPGGVAVNTPLGDIATPPDCRNLLLLSEFPVASVFRYTFTADGCATPTAFSYCCQNMDLPPGISFFLMLFGEKGATVTLRSRSSEVSFLLASDTYPDIIDFEYRLTSEARRVDAGYIERTALNVTENQNFAFGSFIASFETDVDICFHALVDDSV